MEKKTKQMRGKSADTLLMEALEDLNRYEHAETVEPERIQSARTRVITLKQLAAEKKSRKIAKLQSQLKAAQDEVAALKAKAGEIPPEVTEKITQLEAANSDMRQQLLNQPERVVTVVQPDPATIAENAALKVALKFATERANWGDDHRVTLVVALYDKDAAAAETLAKALGVRFADVKSLMSKSDSELLGFAKAYRSPLAQVAQAIITYRIKAESQAEKEKNNMRFAV